jgi:ATP-dependent Clp protease ATP-binding subunit ClpB
MTSNIGSHIIQENFEEMGKKDPEEVAEKTKAEVFDLLKKSMRPEFLNRIDEVIMFKPLNRKEIRGIVRIHLQHLAEALKLKDIRMHITEEAENLLCEEGFDPQFGARPVKRVLQKQVLNELSKALLANKVSVSEIVVMDAIDRKIVFRRPIKQEEEIALVM